MIKDLELPEHCVIAAIIREGQFIVPKGSTTFEVMDEVLAVVDREAAEHLAAWFRSNEDRDSESANSSQTS
jgi:trk system potassium uptake protein TrkA